MLFGGASLLATSAVDAWGAYVPLLGLTGFALGLGWTLPSIGSWGGPARLAAVFNRGRRSIGHQPDRSPYPPGV
jgi:hypothetical protein